MYVHPAFKVHPAASLAFAAARGFGLVIACDAGRPVASHLPFRLIEQDGKVPKLEFHVARANPLGSMAEKGGTWLVAGCTLKAGWTYMARSPVRVSETRPAGFSRGCRGAVSGGRVDDQTRSTVTARMGRRRRVDVVAIWIMAGALYL